VEDDVNIWHYTILQLHARNYDNDEEGREMAYVSVVTLPPLVAAVTPFDAWSVTQ